MLDNKEEKDIELTQVLIAKKERKKKTLKSLFISLGTISVVAVAATGLGIVIHAAKENKI